METVIFGSVVEIVVDAQCQDSWNSEKFSGTYQAMGAFGDYAMYKHESPDEHGNWWYFLFDAASSGWTFADNETVLVPGQTAWDNVILPFNNQPGKSSNTRHTFFLKKML